MSVPHAEASSPVHPAQFMVHTVNGPTYACMQHARMLVEIFGFMGASTFPTVLDDDDPHECANCVNEAKSRSRRPREDGAYGCPGSEGAQRNEQKEPQ